MARTTCYNRFVRWRKAGVWGSDDGRHHRRTPRRHPDDRQHFRSCPSTGCDGKKGGTDADHCLGRSRGGLATKIHAVVDAQGLPIRLGLTTGQAHDGQIAYDKLAANFLAMVQLASMRLWIRANEPTG